VHNGVFTQINHFPGGSEITFWFEIEEEITPIISLNQGKKTTEQTNKLHETDTKEDCIIYSNKFLQNAD